MGRRSDHTREELTALAIEVAYNIAVTEGLAGLSARKVAAQMGYTAGTLYNLFTNFDGLVVMVNARILDELHEEIKDAETLQELALAYLNFAKQKPNLWSLLFEHRLPAGQDLPPWFDNKINRLFGLVEKAILREYPNSENPSRSAKTIWSAVHGILVLAHSQKLDTVQAENAEILINHFLERFTLA